MRILGIRSSVLLLACFHLADARAADTILCDGLKAKAKAKPEDWAKDTDAVLERANKDQAKAQAALDDAVSKLALAQKARDAALAGVTMPPAGAAASAAITDASQAVRDAADQREKAKEELDDAVEDSACVQGAHDAARRFVHGLGLAASGAYAADHTERLGLALRYIHPSDSALTWELALGLSHFRLSRPDEDRETLYSLLSRWSFGRDRVALSLGGGLAWLPQGGDEMAAPRSFAVMGELGVAFRVNHKCSVATSHCVTPWFDFRPFVQPWFPFDGSRAAILFGLELGASIGFGRSEVE